MSLHFTSSSLTGKESTCNEGDPSLIPGSGRSFGEGIGYRLQYFWTSWCSDGKESACNVGDVGSTPGLGRSPGGRHGNPLQYSCLENLHGQRSLAGYSLWGCKQLDTTEQLSMVQRKILLTYLISHRIFASCP